MAGLFSLASRTALVTGGGRGVGAAIAETLARQGAQVIVNDLYTDRARAVADRIRADGGAAVAAVADVTDRAAVEAAIAAGEQALGPVEILVNNAGIPVSGMNFKPFAESEPEDWQSFIELNLTAVLLVTRLVVGRMTERKHGRIVTVVSDAGRVGEPLQAVYAASKAAAAGFSRSLAKEVGKHGVTCNCVALGSIANPERPKDPERLAKQLKFYPVRRLGLPEDVASAVAWLASDEAGWVTGQTIPVNGGYSTS